MMSVPLTETLNAVAIAPLNYFSNMLKTSWAAMIDTPKILIKLIQAVTSLLATLFIAPAIAWFIAIKATEFSINITATAINVTAKS